MPEYRKFYEAEILGHGGSDTLGYGNKGAPSKTSAPAAAPPPDGAQP